MRFIETGATPAKREIGCPGRYVRDYVPLPPERARSFATAEDALESFRQQVRRLPEYWYWDGQEAQATACPISGSVRFRATDDGTAFTFDDCAFTRGVAVTGTGAERDGRVTIAGTLAGRWRGPFRFTPDGLTWS